MGGGNRPWIGNPVKLKIESIGKGKLVASYDVADPPDVEAGDEYVAVFHKPPADSGSGDPEKPEG